MRARMATALLSLAGVFLALYLELHKLGVIGTLACGTGGCEAVQFSSYSRIFGVDVPVIGIAGYGTLFVLSLVSLQRPADRRWPALLRWLALGGVLFTVYLTCIELFVLRTICRWCVGSAVIITLVCLAAWLGPRWAGAPGDE
jgi:uncharacterized membrane protein